MSVMLEDQSFIMGDQGEHILTSFNSFSWRESKSRINKSVISIKFNSTKKDDLLPVQLLDAISVYVG